MWSDIFIPSGRIDSDEQAANYARQQALYEERLRTRQEEGTLDVKDAVFTPPELFDQNGAAWAGAGEGAVEGAHNVLDFVTETVPDAVNSTLSGAVGSVWRAIPFSVLLIGAVAVFVWMGGLSLLKGRFAK